MSFRAAHMSRGLEVFALCIYFANAEPDFAFHIQKHLALWRYYHTATAKRGVFAERHRRADQVRVCVVAKEFVDNGKGIVSVGTL